MSHQWWIDLGAGYQTGVVVLAALVVHLLVSRVLLRGMRKVADSTDNDVDDRLVHFFQRFYVVVLIFVVFLVVMKIHGIKVTPLLASAGIAGIAIDYNVDLDKGCEVARQAIEDSEGVLPGTADVIVRSLWDDNGGHMLSGVLLEGRYKIEDVRDRSRIRSRVLMSIAKACQEADVPLASPRVRVETL